MRCGSQRENVDIFSSTTMNEGKAETITMEDESQSEDDNSEELYQPVFMRTEERCPFPR